MPYGREQAVERTFENQRTRFEFIQSHCAHECRAAHRNTIAKQWLSWPLRTSIAEGSHDILGLADAQGGIITARPTRATEIDQQTAIPKAVQVRGWRQ